MSMLFTPGKIGQLELKNRFIHSATYEAMAEESGEVTEKLVNRYRRLAKGEVGLIIPGYIFVHPAGKGFRYQMGIHNDEMIPGLKSLTDAVHQEGGKVVFQLMHAGRQTRKSFIGQDPMGPSKMGRDPLLEFSKTVPLTEVQILEIIEAFGMAAKRAVAAGADGIQLHSAHGYLINQFLSPFFNKRDDNWGGTNENRFRLIKKVIETVKKEMPGEMPLLVKLNTNDYTPKEGVTPELAATYAKWLGEMNIDAIEVSCGTGTASFMNMCRGEVPVKEIVSTMPFLMKPLGKMMMNKMVGKFDLEEPYNLDAAKLIKPVIGDTALCLVGGIRSKANMEEILKEGHVDFLSMSRPFIREPSIVKKLKEGKVDEVDCESCNRCLIAVTAELPVKCYNKGFPSK